MKGGCASAWCVSFSLLCDVVLYMGGCCTTCTPYSPVFTVRVMAKSKRTVTGTSSGYEEKQETLARQGIEDASPQSFSVSRLSIVI